MMMDMSRPGCLKCGESVDRCTCRLGLEADRATYQSPRPVLAGAPELEVSITLDGPWDWWLKPVRKQLETAAGSIHKPLAEVTMDELVSWGILGCYSYVVGMVAGRILARLVT